PRPTLLPYTTLFRSGLPAVDSGPVPATPTAEDLTDLASLNHPACYLRFPTLDMLAANSDYQRLFPGLGAGTNLLEWMFLNPAARSEEHTSELQSREN